MGHGFDPTCRLTSDEAERLGEEEMRRCRAQPWDRAASPIAALQRPAWRRILRASVARIPVDSPLVARARRGAAFLRGANRAAPPSVGLAGYFRATVPVLVYHHVGTPLPGRWPLLTVSPDRFASHIRCLARAGYVGIRPSQWLGWRHDGAALPSRPVIVTFDDAYADVAECAFPVLEDHGFAAGAFIVTRRIGTKSTWDAAGGFKPRALMSARQILHWHGRGVEFGAHGRTHADLTTLSDDAIDDEVGGSIEDMRQLLGIRPVSFAYPYGHVDTRVRSHVRLHVDLAFVVQGGRGLNDLATDTLAQLRSLVEPCDTALDVLCRVRTGVPLRWWLPPLDQSHYGTPDS